MSAVSTKAIPAWICCADEYITTDRCPQCAQMRPGLLSMAGPVIQAEPTALDRWSAFVDEGLRELLFSGAALALLLLKVALLAIVTPFAWLGHGAAVAMQELSAPATKD